MFMTNTQSVHSTRKVSLEVILEKMRNAGLVTLTYKLTNLKNRRQELIEEYTDKIQTMTVYEIYNELEEVLGSFFDSSIKEEIRQDDYKIRLKDNDLETNEYGYILFDSLEGVKSVLPKNIISVIINGTLYER